MTALLAVRPQPRRRVVAVSAVLLGHVAILLLVWQEKFAASPGSEVSRTVTLRLVPERIKRLPPQPDSQPAPPTRRLPVPSAAPEAAGISTLVAVPADAGTPSSEPGTAAAATPGLAASGIAPLALTPSREVLRGTLANPATTDPRSHTPKPTFEERFAMGLDPRLCVKLERLPDGTEKRSMGKLGHATTLLQASHGVGAMEPLVCL